MILSQKVDSKVLRMAIELKYFDEKRQNGDCNVRNFRRFLFGMRLDVDVPAFKVRVLTSDLNF